MKKVRQQVYDKYNGLCAYTGKPLDEKWQVDHIIPQVLFKIGRYLGDCNHIDNLMPSCRIINHYKRGETLEGFRAYMLNFHIRLSKLPKKTKIQKTIKRIEYLNEVARELLMWRINGMDNTTDIHNFSTEICDYLGIERRHNRAIIENQLTEYRKKYIFFKELNPLDRHFKPPTT